MAYNFSGVPGIDRFRELRCRALPCSMNLQLAAAAACSVCAGVVAVACAPLPLLPAVQPLLTHHRAPAPVVWLPPRAAYPSTGVPAVVPFNSAYDDRSTGYFGSMSRYMRTWLAVQVGRAPGGAWGWVSQQQHQ